MKLFNIVLALSIMGFAAASASAAEHGTAEEAIAMVKKAVAYVNVNGKDKTIAEINAQSSQFREKDIYVFVTDMSGKQLANWANPRMAGKDILELRDSAGKYFVKELVEVAKTKGKGWVDYRWPNPATTNIESKSAYVERVGDIFIGAGVYK